MGGDADEGAPPSKRARLNHYLEYSVLLGRGGEGGGGAGGGSCDGGEGGTGGGEEGEEGGQQGEGGGLLSCTGEGYPFRSLLSASASSSWLAGTAAFAFLPLAMAGKPCGSADGGGGEDTTDAAAAVAAAAAAAGAPHTLECSLGHLPSVDSEQTIGSKGQIRKSEFIRIIAQALYSLGYNGAASRLEEESGVCLQSPAVASFRECILGGRWDECVALLSLLQLDDSVEILKRATFEILQQKFLELLEQGKPPQALKVLRCELGALGINTWRLHQLASCVMCTCKEDLMLKAGWSGSSVQSRYDLLLTLQNLLPPSVLIPERRLEALVEQALSVQRENCLFHNTRDQTLSLLSDHQCGKDLIPCEATAVLEEHTDEVWYVQFSHDGTRLATASKDRSVIVWQVFDAYHVKIQHKLVGHEGHLSFVAWSPDDKMLLTCGQEKFVKLWDMVTGECKRTFLKHTELVSACAWFPDNRRFVTGGSDKCIYFWDIDGTELDCHKTNARISDLMISQDGLRMISAGEKEIKIHRFDDKSDRTITLDNSITSLCISRDDRYMLASLVIEEIHLWDLNAKPLSDKPTYKYKGQKRVRFVIRSCFGGSDEAFIASGSEDSQVYIWLRRNGELVEKLAGHSGTVNAVSWNPVNPHMFASASDDKTVRLWGLSTPSQTGMNGYHGFEGLGNGNGANGGLQLTAASNGNC